MHHTGISNYIWYGGYVSGLPFGLFLSLALPLLLLSLFLLVACLQEQAPCTCSLDDSPPSPSPSAPRPLFLGLLALRWEKEAKKPTKAVSQVEFLPFF